MAIGDLFGSFPGFGGDGIVTLLAYMILGVLIIGGLALGFFLWIKSKRKWYIKVEVKIPRSDGKIIKAEWAKGTYSAKQGVVLIKRNKLKPVAIKPFDVKKYLQGTDILTVVQVGIEDFRPVLQESYLEMVDDETGEEAALLTAKIDTSESKSWKSSFERDAKNAYSIETIFQQYAQYIGFGILFFMIFVGFAILWGRIQ